MKLSELHLRYYKSGAELCEMQIEVLRIASKHLSTNVNTRTLEAFNEAYPEALKVSKLYTLSKQQQKILEEGKRLYKVHGKSNK